MSNANPNPDPVPAQSTPQIKLPPNLTDDEQRAYRQQVEDFLDALPPGSPPPNIFLLKAIYNAAAHVVTTHRANQLLHALGQLPPETQEKQRAIQARLLAQAARNTQITTKLLAEIEKRWPAASAAPQEDPASRLGKYAPYLSRFQDLMDQLDIEETARELGCEPHEVPGLPTRIPFPKDAPPEHPIDPPLHPQPPPSPPFPPVHPADATGKPAVPCRTRLPTPPLASPPDPCRHNRGIDSPYLFRLK